MSDTVCKPAPFARVNDIIGIAAEMSLFSVDEIKGKARFQSLTRVRFAVYHVARIHGHSYPKIGAIINRDHSSVIHGADQCLNLAGRDREYAKFVSILTDRAANALPFQYEQKGRKPISFEFVLARPATATPVPAKVRAIKARNDFSAGADEGDAAHKFHAQMAKGSDPFAAAINAARKAA